MKTARALLAIACLALVPAVVHGADLRVVRIWNNYRSAHSFKRISEYFTGHENTGGQLIARTHPESRGGYYFLIRLKSISAAALPAGKIILDIITPAGPDPKHYEFPFNPGSKRSAVLLDGLTGADWPGPDAHPVAWKLQIVDTKGHAIAEKQSYLWTFPTSKD